MGCEGPTAETDERVISTPTVKIAKIREDIRGRSLGCHDYVSLCETRPPSKSLHPMVTVDRNFGWVVVLSRRPPGKLRSLAIQISVRHRRHMQFRAVQFIFQEMIGVVLNAPAPTPVRQQ
jgi:hypothetical protein